MVYCNHKNTEGLECVRNELQGGKTMSIMTWWMRRGMKKGDAKRDAGLTIPEDIFRVDNISYGSHKMNVLDVYRPKSVK